MSTVVIYGFEGKFVGNATYEYEHPQIGAKHKCMLFLMQEREDPQHDRALLECAKFGFAEVVFRGCGPLQVEMLNTEQYRGFAAFYEEALRDGNALVYYPNT